jgi:hypothetical protein
MASEIEEPRGLAVLFRDHEHDPERIGLQRLLRLAPGRSYAEVARVWARVRQARNRAALERMERGDSSGGFGRYVARPRRHKAA